MGIRQTPFCTYICIMHLEGVVLKSTGKWYTVSCSEVGILSCRIRGKLRLNGLSTTNPIAVGDRVSLEVSDEDPTEGVILDVAERNNYIVRKSTNLSKQMQILAANIDRAYLVVTMHSPVTQPAFIDRFLVAAESFRIPVTILFNKSDLYGPKEKLEAEKWMDCYSRIGYLCYLISALHDTDLQFLRDEISHKQVMISGHSGVGKSTLVNALDSELSLRTGEISKAHQQGQHTTTFAEMFALKTGGYIIDTPGIRAFGLIDLEKSHLAHYFPEMRERMNHCKFHNCLHQNEPGCAVKEAAKQNEIAPSRYQNYLDMLLEDPTETYRKNKY
jgi:ribosome biogenesis GTPase